ncbi:hypothetical protein K432DRAFT_424421 [Lepidopterella palustris CBS 459.81]|uniref:Uncharacterized protein n=1 Tax=Lepidopterella palustris CBS 459.81 TaxID=1314670 RepID=A0A8E2JGT2_9PEZI|nr:hypothetical protein K432DRAFT_424421 [Lepidopterella palustris CBS 459.81]
MPPTRLPFHNTSVLSYSTSASTITPSNIWPGPKSSSSIDLQTIAFGLVGVLVAVGSLAVALLQLRRMYGFSISPPSNDNVELDDHDPSQPTEDGEPCHPNIHPEQPSAGLDVDPQDDPTSFPNPHHRHVSQSRHDPT